MSDPDRGQPEGEDYSGLAKAAGAYESFAHPVESLLASEVLQSREHDPARRRTLESWSRLSLVAIIASIVLGAIALTLALVVVGHGSGSSGPEPLGPQRTVTLPDGSLCTYPAGAPKSLCTGTTP